MEEEIDELRRLLKESNRDTLKLIAINNKLLQENTELLTKVDHLYGQLRMAMDYGMC